jgi:transketolase
MEQTEKKALQIAACKIRMGAIEAVYSAQSGHPGGSLSAADIIADLYFRELNIDPSHPKMENRDRFVLSKGHTCPGLYAALALKGYFPWDELKSFRHTGALLQGHPDMKAIPGIEMSTGSLGQGVAAAGGMALAGKLDQKSYRVYSLLGDGEIEEGEVWEAAMFAGHHKLDNLCWIIDNNGLQIDGPVADVGGPEPIDKKFEAFNFDVQKIDGHDLDAIDAAFCHAKTVKGKPSVIIAKTVKGKGVSYMENQVGWHGKAPNDKQYQIAMQELKTVLSGLEAE